jgi:ribonuclease HII
MMGIIKGDALSYLIGAASIIAKQYRDKIMIDYAEKYPVYGFERHKGYGTKQHREALIEYGPCAIHRATFIKKIMAAQNG